jgi:hypothetical protein
VLISAPLQFVLRHFTVRMHSPVVQSSPVGPVPDEPEVPDDPELPEELPVLSVVDPLLHASTQAITHASTVAGMVT